MNKVRATNDEQKLSGEIDELQLFTIGGTSKPFCADHVVKDRQLTIEIDTDAAVSQWKLSLVLLCQLLQSRRFEISILNYLYNCLTPF